MVSGLPDGLEIAGLVGKTHDAVGVGDINPFRIVARKECDAERFVQPAGIDLAGGRFRGAIGRAQHSDLSSIGLGDEDVAIGRDPHLARPVQPFGEQRNLETIGYLRNGLGRAGDHMRNVGRRRRRAGLGQVFRLDQSTHAGRTGAPVAERGAAGQQLRFGRGMTGAANDACQCQPVQHTNGENHQNNPMHRHTRSAQPMKMLEDRSPDRYGRRGNRDHIWIIGPRGQRPHRAKPTMRRGVSGPAPPRAIPAYRDARARRTKRRSASVRR